MPEAVIYQHRLKIYTIYFSRASALLPVKLVTGEVKLVTWGCRQQENSEMPRGGWARLSAIHSGKWNQYAPKPVLLPIDKFMKTDFEGHIHWYQLAKGQYIQGLLASNDNQEFRVYIVTITPELLNICHDRWPRIVVKKQQTSKSPQ